MGWATARVYPEAQGAKTIDNPGRGLSFAGEHVHAFDDARELIARS